jgi:hypothetical protein
VFENRVLKKIFGLKREDLTGGWGKLHNEELRNFAKYNWNDQVKEDEMDRACNTNGEKRNAYRILVGNPKQSDQEEDQDIGGWKIFKRILDRMGWYGLD